jgi:hypothetical protein
MTFIDFNARAELYLGSDHSSAKAEGGRRFRTAANALRFALEEAAPVSLRGASLIVGNRTFLGTQLTELYYAADYPLPRKVAVFHRRKAGVAAKYRQPGGFHPSRTKAPLDQQKAGGVLQLA